ncbi:MAG: nucleotidyl transferase AbiEii/AbiGii toxin family protein [Proteobacteria bacterium]|nr:nucleotidyl transferase AbiEii/AbiGii toxin family protein [Pseudomonadota bacterium]
MQVEYYNKIIYPLQDKAIPAFKDSPFYLTGGTALSRGYYNHRYSDDLDYFVNFHPEFKRLAQIQVDRLLTVFNHKVEVDYKGEHFYRIFVAEERLKIELVNDVPSHTGALVDHPVIGRIDSKENILANKLTAIVDRTLPKDIVDIYFLLKDRLDLKRALTEAESKAAGIAPLLIAKIFAEFDYKLLDTEIKWVTPVLCETIGRYMNTISLAIVEGKE